MRNSNLLKLNPCIMCKSENIQAQYLENRRYRYSCPECGQYFELNAPSQMGADLIYNYHISREEAVQNDDRA